MARPHHKEMDKVKMPDYIREMAVLPGYISERELKEALNALTLLNEDGDRVFKFSHSYSFDQANSMLRWVRELRRDGKEEERKDVTTTTPDITLTRGELLEYYSGIISVADAEKRVESIVQHVLKHRLPPLDENSIVIDSRGELYYYDPPTTNDDPAKAGRFYTFRDSSAYSFDDIKPIRDITDEVMKLRPR